MKRGIAVLVSLCALLAAGYFTASKWAIRHESLTFNDLARDNRTVAVNIAVRRDKEMQANADMITLPVAILNHGNTVKSTEYSFLTNFFAMRGYLAISIQHDLPTDAPMVTKVDELYVGRQPQYLRGIANIKFAVEEMKKVQPNADYDRLTMVGHSAGADISMYFAKMYPDHIKELVTLDNLRVPFMTDGKFKILSFRSKDPQFKTDPGVVPPEGVREKSGITVVQTGYQHSDMSDRGSDNAKSAIQGMLDKFLDDQSPLKPVVTIALPLMTDPGPVAPYCRSHRSRTDAGITRFDRGHHTCREKDWSAITQYDARTGRWAITLVGLRPAKPKACLQTLHGECGIGAVITTLGSNYIIRTHKHRPRNKREPLFGATIGDAKH